ncbi:MAG: polyprotein of L1-like non-LTR retrotransposon Zorro 1, partial [Cyanobacteriota bacterium]
SCIRDAIPVKSMKSKPIRFWTPELSKAKNARNAARRNIIEAGKKGKNLSRRIIKYKQRKREFSKAFAKARLLNLNQRIKVACLDKTGAEIYKLIRDIQPKLNKKAKPYLTNDKPPAIEAEQIADKFALTFDPQDAQPNNAEEDETQETILSLKLAVLLTQPLFITLRELKQAVNAANSRSAPGPDNISNKIIKWLSENESFMQLLLCAVNNHLKTGEYPQSLKAAGIVALPKDKPGDFRPISLLSNISKIMEYIMQQRIRMAIQNKMPPNQFGCKPGHSTAQALMRLMHYIGISAAQNQQFGCIFYDFTKAYDRVPKHIVLKKW